MIVKKKFYSSMLEVEIKSVPEDDGSRTLFIYLEDAFKGKTNSKSLRLTKTEDYTDLYSLVDEQIDNLVDKSGAKNQAFKKLSRSVISNWFY